MVLRTVYHKVIKKITDENAIRYSIVRSQLNQLLSKPVLLTVSEKKNTLVNEQEPSSYFHPTDT